MTQPKEIKVGIIGGGLMGKEAASTFGRWFVLNDFPVKPILHAVADLQTDVLDWYKKIPSVKYVTTSYQELINDSEIEVVYVAVPHHLHEKIYIDVLNANKDLFAEKPFGVDLEAALRIYAKAKETKSYVRCSSEFPFLPGVQRIVSEFKKGGFGKLLEINCGFLHSSDLDPTKPINWKRQTQFCGETGVMADLGLHALHVPLKLGLVPSTIYAQLQKIYTERPDGKGEMMVCDTWDNATLHTEVNYERQTVPMTIELKRMSPGETNTWYIEILGTNRGVKYSTKEPKTFWTFERLRDQQWSRTDLGFQMTFPVITGQIFEPGFPDCFQQMFAAFFAEREGFLDNSFGCVTAEEAVMSQRIFSAALQSFNDKRVTLIRS